MRVQNISFGQQFLLLKSKQSLKKTLSSRLEYLSQLFRSSAERNKSLGESNDRALQLAQVYNAMHLWLDSSNVNDLVVKCEHPDAIPFDYLFPRLISITQDDVLASNIYFIFFVFQFIYYSKSKTVLHFGKIWLIFLLYIIKFYIKVTFGLKNLELHPLMKKDLLLLFLSQLLKLEKINIV